MIKPIITLILTSCLLLADAIKSDTQISITIQGVPQADAQDFNKPYSVYGTGTIRIPHLGEIRAAGRTPAQLARDIESRYRAAEIYTNPTINVDYKIDDVIDQKTFTYRSTSGSKVMPYQKDMTLQVAVAAAGGQGTFDSKRFVELERNQKVYKYDLNDVQHRNVKVYPNDVLKVPHINEENRLFKLFKWKK